MAQLEDNPVTSQFFIATTAGRQCANEEHVPVRGRGHLHEVTKVATTTHGRWHWPPKYIPATGQ